MSKNLIRTAFAALFCAAPLLFFAQPKIQLTQHAAGFVRPVDVAHCGDSRLFVVEQRGMIWVLDSLGNRLQDTFLNIIDRVLSTGNEQGLLGLAFPPDFAQSGVFYVNYTRKTDGDTRVSRFSLKPGKANQADPASEQILLTQDQPYSNHNGGCVKFGPDGYLYTGLGDGGNGGDPQNYGQTKNTLLGKMLRIDVDTTSPGLPYAIPPSNPFVNDPAFRPEIWAWGLRNPWRFSFDRLTGDLWIGDVGQVTREEIDFEPAGTGGRNYGWRCYEGTFPHNTTGCQPASAYTGPVFDYDNNSLGCSVTGGFVYRGAKYPDLYGAYLFTDYCSGRWWTVRQRPNGTFVGEQIADLTNNQYSSLGEDRDGELYVSALSQGIIYKLRELCSAFQISGTVTHASCEGALNGIIDLNIAGGTGPYTINWSNNQTDSVIVYLDPGLYSVQVQDAQGCIRRDTFEVESLAQISVPTVSAVAWTAPLQQAALLCPGDTVTLEAAEAPSGYSYQWYRDDVKLPGATGQQFAAQQTGLYHVVYENVVCKSAPSAPFPILQQVVLFPPFIVDSTEFCEGGSTSITAAAPLPGFILQWLRNGIPISGANGVTLEVTESGAYEVDFVRPGCTLDVSSPIELEEIVVPAPDVIAAGTLNLCAGDSTLLLATDGAPGLGFQWYKDGAPLPGTTTNQLTVKNAGAYQVQFTDAPCPAPLSQPVEVKQSFPPVIEQNGGVLSISGGPFLSIQWVVQDGANWVPAPNGNGPSFDASAGGVFAVQVVDAFGCSYEALPVTVTDTRLPAQVTFFRLAPNPAEDAALLTLHLKKSERAHVVLRDARGREIQSSRLEGQRLEHKIDLRNAPAGTYYLTIQLETGNIVRALVRK